MRHAVSNELYRYWRALGTSRCPPERSEVDPGAIRSVLADTYVLDFDAGAGFPFRISGSNVNALFLKELRGASFLKIWRDGDRERVPLDVDGKALHVRLAKVFDKARQVPVGLDELVGGQRACLLGLQRFDHRRDVLRLCIPRHIVRR